MQIFDAEKAIAHLIENDKTIAFLETQTDTAKASEGESPTEELIEYLKEGTSVTFDSYWFPAILVTTNWNRNDDVFTPEQIWPARNTPINKPVSWCHNASEENNEVIGVILRSVPVDINYKVITEPCNYYHLAVSSVIWNKYFPTYGQEIKEGIDKKELFVSMECHFPDFGFAIRKPGSSNISFIERNAKTAIFTKYLRGYGGPGIVKIAGETYQIGRWLKNITFTGMGMVHTPGNIESKILSVSTASYNENLDNVLENSVLISKAESTIMATENSNAGSLDTLMAELTAVKAELADAKKAMAEAEASASAMKEACAKMTEEMAKSAEASATANATASESLAAKDKTIAELQASLAALQETMAAMKKDAMATARLEQLKTVNAESWLSTAELETIDEKTFATILSGAKKAFEAITKATATVKKETPENTTESATAALTTAEADKVEETANAGLAGSAAANTTADDDQAKLTTLMRNSFKNRKAKNAK